MYCVLLPVPFENPCANKIDTFSCYTLTTLCRFFGNEITDLVCCHAVLNQHRICRFWKDTGIVDSVFLVLDLKKFVLLARKCNFLPFFFG